jgi:hypothetical protein
MTTLARRPSKISKTVSFDIMSRQEIEDAFPEIDPKHFQSTKPSPFSRVSSKSSLKPRPVSVNLPKIEPKVQIKRRPLSFHASRTTVINVLPINLDELDSVQSDSQPKLMLLKKSKSMMSQNLQTPRTPDVYSIALAFDDKINTIIEESESECDTVFEMNKAVCLRNLNSKVQFAKEIYNLYSEVLNEMLFVGGSFEDLPESNKKLLYKNYRLIKAASIRFSSLVSKTLVMSMTENESRKFEETRNCFVNIRSKIQGKSSLHPHSEDKYSESSDTQSAFEMIKSLKSKMDILFSIINVTQSRLSAHL